MKVVILNWKSGENDPFTVINRAIAGHLTACGKNVETIETADTAWPRRLEALLPGGIEFALTWQGVGSSVELVASGESIWDHFQVPLICLHGDHPAHMPPNHELESRYCFHLYTNAEFARYSNRHFRHIRGASVVDLPHLHRERPLAISTGEHFVMAKNIDDPIALEQRWREELDDELFSVYMSAAEMLTVRLAREAYVEVHDALDDLIREGGIERLDQAVDIEAHHRFHSRLDFYLRSHKAIAVLAGVADFPVRVYGRGWERLARGASRHHVFEPGRDMASSQAMYYSRFGLIDVSPSKGLHDRTRRAMANGTGFLSSANLEDHFVALDRYSSLFFNFTSTDIAQKCAAVVADPEAHRERARSFSQEYHSRFHFRNFVQYLDLLAKSVERR